MDVLFRIGVSAWRLLRCAYPKHEMVLRHGSSGRPLIADLEDPEPVRFPSPAAALAFRTRWLDEPQAWAPQPAASAADGRAA
jgi:hypothetical protein